MDIPRQHWKKRTCNVNRVAAAEEGKKERKNWRWSVGQGRKYAHSGATREREREDTERVKNRKRDGEGKETDNLVMYSRTIDRTYTRRINQIWLQVREESRNCSQREREQNSWETTAKERDTHNLVIFHLHTLLSIVPTQVDLPKFGYSSERKVESRPRREKERESVCVCVFVFCRERFLEVGLDFLSERSAYCWSFDGFCVSGANFLTHKNSIWR